MPTILAAKPQTSSNDLATAKVTPRCYQADQQVKYLHLQAEIDVLLQQLRTIEQQKQADSEVDLTFTQTRSI
jgi:uncharacterized protein with WD repeat